jgi:LuxR family maltose regulon positive regulatory protein
MVREKRLAEAGAVVLGYITLARLRQARGDGPGALAVLDELQAVLRERNFAPHLLARATAVRSRLALLQGDLAMAVKWADSSDLGVNDELTYLREPEYLTLARVRIVQGRHAPAGSHLGDALHLLGRLLETAEAGQRMDSVIEILTLRALALRAQGDRDGALTALNRALSLAAPEGYVRVFADEGAHMAALLHEARARGIAPGYVPKLLAAFVREDVQATPAAPPSPAPDRRSVPPGIKPLTEREMEVIRLLARGQSNQVIARELVVAVGTVKRHVNSVLGKLQVQSRLEAVARARELGLV